MRCHRHRRLLLLIKSTIFALIHQAVRWCLDIGGAPIIAAETRSQKRAPLSLAVEEVLRTQKDLGEGCVYIAPLLFHPPSVLISVCLSFINVFHSLFFICVVLSPNPGLKESIAGSPLISQTARHAAGLAVTIFSLLLDCGAEYVLLF
jgi:hypothetical protein